MNHNNPAQREIGERQRQDTATDRRIRTIEMTLINDNETVRRVLEACKRIQRRWEPPETEKQP
jgi:hypothetical protein